MVLTRVPTIAKEMRQAPETKADTPQLLRVTVESTIRASMPKVTTITRNDRGDLYKSAATTWSRVSVARTQLTSGLHFAFECRLGVPIQIRSHEFRAVIDANTLLEMLQRAPKIGRQRNAANKCRVRAHKSDPHTAVSHR